MDPIRWLQDWYATQCNGDWEHQYGVLIETLDNPGWMVRIDLVGTRLEKQPFQNLDWESENGNWLHCRVKDNAFAGYADPHSLLSICDAFRRWAESLPEVGR